MDMVWASLCLYNFYPFILAQFSQDAPDICPNLSIYCFSPIFWCKDYVLFIVPACMCKTIYFLFLLCSKHGYSSSATFLAVGKPASIAAWEVYLFPLIGLAFFIPRAQPVVACFQQGGMPPAIGRELACLSQYRICSQCHILLKDFAVYNRKTD